MYIPRTRVPEFVWPAIPEDPGALLLSLQFQLEQSQWLPREALISLQMRQLDGLLRHARETVPYYREQLAGISLDEPLTLDRWQQIPLLPRDVLQFRGDELLSTNPPPGHGSTFEKKTSGSTGLQMKITDTDASNLFWMAMTMRDHLWHRRNLAGRLVSIRSGRSGKDPMTVHHADSWGPSTGHIYNTGPCTVFYHTMPLEKQSELLLELQPEYLLLYPSNAMRLAQYFRHQNLRLDSLSGIITYGELLLPEVREDCFKTWGAPVSDMYSCEEVGYIALQCPEFGNYHCQSESVLVEVLNEDNEPCAPGEIGRIALTALHNFAMPLIRYANRDYAEVGFPCPCGRGYPVLHRLLGRQRNMAIGGDGDRFWPNLSRRVWAHIEAIDELQLVQDSSDHIELRMVALRELTPIETQSLTDQLCEALGQSYSFTLKYQTDIIRHANGKYERFICQLAD